MNEMNAMKLFREEAGALLAYWDGLGSLDSPELQEKKLSYGRSLRQYALWQQAPHSSGRVKALFFHGGAWTFGSPERFRHHGYFFIREGLDCVLPSVRRLPVRHGSHIRADLTALLRLLDEHFGTDTRWILGGVSSGGHLATLLATDPALLTGAGWSVDRLAGLLLIAPPLDLDHMPPPVKWALGRGSSPARTDPMAFVDQSGDLEVILLQGGQDPVVPPKAVYPWIRARQALFPECTTWIEQESLGHMDLVRWSFPGNPLGDRLRDWLQDIGRE